MSSKEETVNRPLNAETEAALPAGPIPLLQRYEQISGIKLEKLPPSKQQPLERTGTLWPWSWPPELCAAFLADWDSQVYMASEPLRNLAMTPDPMGGGFLYERFCKPVIIEGIRKLQIMYDKPLGKLRPVPLGTFDFDLSKAPPGMRPEVFSINEWKFFGHVKNIPQGIRDTLAYMYTRWRSQGMDIMNPKDHATIDVGEVRR